MMLVLKFTLTKDEKPIRYTNKKNGTSNSKEL